jgi:hypothetical protein
MTHAATFERCRVPTTTAKHHDARGRHGRSGGNITTAPAQKGVSTVAQLTNHKRQNRLILQSTNGEWMEAAKQHRDM